MNNFPIPVYPINNNNYYFNIISEINKLKEDVEELKEKINKINCSKENNYLKKEDNYYMI